VLCGRYDIALKAREITAKSLRNPFASADPQRLRNSRAIASQSYCRCCTVASKGCCTSRATQNNATLSNVNTSKRGLAQRNVIQHNEKQCGEMQCNAVQYKAIQCNAKSEITAKSLHNRFAIPLHVPIRSNCTIAARLRRNLIVAAVQSPLNCVAVAVLLRHKAHEIDA
jgi:hypothetical protein